MGKRKSKAPLELKFGGSPPNLHRDYRWAEVADALRQKPGEWAVVHEDVPTSQVSSVQRGRVREVHPNRGFEARGEGVVAGPPKRTRLMWMRYSPDLDESAGKKNGRRKR